MAAYSDKVIKELEPEAIERCKRWNKAFVGESFSEDQIEHLLRLSKLVDSLWKDWAEQQRQLRQRTTDPLPVWGEDKDATDAAWTSLKQKDSIQAQEILGRDVAQTNARLRLKWAMDYWCALWFWPIRQAGSLPSRGDWLHELSMILGDYEQTVGPEAGQQKLFPDTQPKHQAEEFADRHGFVDVEKLKAEFERLRQVEAVAKRIRPLHWDLEFADLLSDGGFDLVIGNPPWLRVQWSTSGHIESISPLYAVRKHSSAQIEKILKNHFLSHPNETLQGLDAKELLTDYEETSSTCAFLSSGEYLCVTGGKINLWKNFLPRSWAIVNTQGISALIHQDALVEDETPSPVRRIIYEKIIWHFQFQNEKKLFDIGNTRKFSLNIYSQQNRSIGKCIFNLYDPKTIDKCIEPLINCPSSRCPGMKTEHGELELKGDPRRVIIMDGGILEASSRLYEQNKLAPEESRLPRLHSTSLVALLQALTGTGSTIGSLRRANKASYATMHDEKAAVVSKIMTRVDDFVPISQYVCVSPSIHIGNIFHQCPRRPCSNHRSFDPIDLMQASSDYLPRAKFQLCTPKPDTCSMSGYKIMNRRQVDIRAPRKIGARALGKHEQKSRTEAAWQESSSDFLIRSSSRLRVPASSYAAAVRLEVRWRYRRKLKVRFLRPHHASVLSSPIFLVSFPPIDMVMPPKTCSTHALIGDS